MEEMYERLEAVLKKLQEAGFVLKRSKVCLLEQELEVLGHQISAEGVKKDKGKVEVIRSIKEPKDMKGVQSFCGMVVYYAKFLPKLADLMKPLYQLTRKGSVFQWSED